MSSLFYYVFLVFFATVVPFRGFRSMYEAKTLNDSSVLLFGGNITKIKVLDDLVVRFSTERRISNVSVYQIKVDLKVNCGVVGGTHFMVGEFTVEDSDSIKSINVSEIMKHFGVQDKDFKVTYQVYALWQFQDDLKEPENFEMKIALVRVYGTTSLIVLSFVNFSNLPCQGVPTVKLAKADGTRALDFPDNFTSMSNISPEYTGTWTILSDSITVPEIICNRKLLPHANVSHYNFTYIDYTCHENYITVRNNKKDFSLCEKGVWKDQGFRGDINCYKLICPKIVLDPAGLFALDTTLPEVRPYRTANGKLFFMCMGGNLKPDYERTMCLSNGKWLTGNIGPKCRLKPEVRCTEQPSQVQNARIVSRGPYKPLESAYYQCLPDFYTTTEQNLSATCTEDLTWSTPSFTCEPLPVCPDTGGKNTSECAEPPPDCSTCNHPSHPNSSILWVTIGVSAFLWVLILVTVLYTCYYLRHRLQTNTRRFRVKPSASPSSINSPIQPMSISLGFSTRTKQHDQLSNEF